MEIDTAQFRKIVAERDQARQDLAFATYAMADMLREAEEAGITLGRRRHRHRRAPRPRLYAVPPPRERRP